ncbi:MAG: tyrosine recombinase XerD [Odoribacteraceae bacterium]|jgi:integrase/recombinase XerD|nr:tyrosine recombinase XerD [Odoribacteraceae bacterium]
MITWKETIENYKAFLTLERGMSANTVVAYTYDIKKLFHFCEQEKPPVPPREVTYPLLNRYLAGLPGARVSARTQARNVSSLKSFFKFLVIDGTLAVNPAEKLETPKGPKTLPNVLSVDEIEAMIRVTGNDYNGQRDRAVLETLYSCGLRVSELTNLKTSNVNFRVGYVKVHGKGNKERLVPLGTRAKEEIRSYQKARDSVLGGRNEDILFLSRDGKKLSRVSIFNIIKKLSLKAGINKIISPHTLRHSFASHLVNGGADIRVVQDMLGHASILTSEIYTHLDSAFLLDMMISHHPRAKKKK